MEFLVLIGVILLVGAVVLFVSGPLRDGSAKVDAAALRRATERAALHAEKDALYRQIRDAELDYRTGKVTEPDWRRADRGLRARAIEVLHRLDDLEDDG